MKLDKRLTGGLAWAGVLVVVAVPAADFVTTRMAPQSAALVSGGTPALDVSRAEVAPIPAMRPVQPTVVVETPAVETPVIEKPVVETASLPGPVVAEPEISKPVEQAVVEPAVVSTPAPTVVPATDPVQSFTSSGKALPSYISDNSDTPVETAAIEPDATPVVVPAQTVPDATQTGSIQPGPKVVIEKPSSGVTFTQTDTTQADTTQIASIDPAPVVELVAPIPAPISMRPLSQVILPAETVRDVATIAPPPADIPVPASDDMLVDEADLADWHSGTLAEYLAQRGQQQAEPDSAFLQFDENGYLVTDDDPPLSSQF